MRIAQVGSLYENIPPPMYGGTERIISSLTEGLVERGHDVTLFATAQAQTKANLVSVTEHPLFRLGVGKGNIMYPLLNFTEAFKRQTEFDLIHIHLSISSDYISLLAGSFLPEKTIYTVHFAAPHIKGYADRAKVLDAFQHLQYISISNAARTGYEHLNWIKTIYNGIEIDQFTFNPQPKDYFAWIGKFNPDKGTKEAILAAKKAGVKLKLAGIIDTEDGEDKTYYEQVIKPLIDGKQIAYVGEKGGKEKDEFLGNAIGFLNPIQWEEPFGLVSVESMATGTPVISLARGALKETIKHGVSGYLVKDLDEMVARMKDVKKLKRQDSRTWVEAHFTADKMVSTYEKLYKELLQKNS